MFDDVRRSSGGGRDAPGAARRLPGRPRGPLRRARPAVPDVLRVLRAPAAPPPARRPAGDGHGRHCWVLDPPDAPGTWPGLLVEWRQREDGWHGRVAYTVVGTHGPGAGGGLAARRPARSRADRLAGHPAGIPQGQDARTRRAAERRTTTMTSPHDEPTLDDVILPEEPVARDRTQHGKDPHPPTRSSSTAPSSSGRRWAPTTRPGRRLRARRDRGHRGEDGLTRGVRPRGAKMAVWPLVDRLRAPRLSGVPGSGSGPAAGRAAARPASTRRPAARPPATRRPARPGRPACRPPRTRRSTRTSTARPPGPTARPPSWARAATQPLATPCAAKNPVVSTHSPRTTHQSGAGSVSAMPAAISPTAAGTTSRRPNRSASAPAVGELADPSR